MYFEYCSDILDKDEDLVCEYDEEAMFSDDNTPIMVLRHKYLDYKN